MVFREAVVDVLSRTLSSQTFEGRCGSRDDEKLRSPSVEIVEERKERPGQIHMHA